MANATGGGTKKELIERCAEMGRTLETLRQRVRLMEAERTKLTEESERLEERARLDARLRERLLQASERFELLVRLTKDVNSLNVDKLLDVCITRVPYLLNAHYASIYTYDPERDRLLLRRHSHNRAIEHTIDLPRHPGSLMAKVIADRKVRVFADLDQAERPEDGAAPEVERHHRDRYNSQSCIVAPLVTGDSVLGVLNLSDPIDGVPFNENEDLGLVQQISEILAVGIRNLNRFDKLEIQARTDSLTKLSNHQTFYDVLGREIERASRYGGDLTVVMIDIDDFKITNDNAGHLAGDHVLIEVAKVIAASVRTVDTAARYGGDEFAIVLPQSDVKAAGVVAERIRNEVMKHQISFDGRDVGCRVSLGLAQLSEGVTGAELVRRADQALYRAKRQGGNRLSVSSERREGVHPDREAS
ncbi:MAG: diguanylate cyclase [Planctomycetota bacterium]|jgi:diguanylate cyclase (GGDEF)-like protein